MIDVEFRIDPETPSDELRVVQVELKEFAHSGVMKALDTCDLELLDKELRSLKRSLGKKKYEEWKHDKLNIHYRHKQIVDAPSGTYSSMPAYDLVEICGMNWAGLMEIWPHRLFLKKLFENYDLKPTDIMFEYQLSENDASIRAKMEEAKEESIKESKIYRQIFAKHELFSNAQPKGELSQEIHPLRKESFSSRLGNTARWEDITTQFFNQFYTMPCQSSPFVRSFHESRFPSKTKTLFRRGIEQAKRLFDRLG